MHLLEKYGISEIYFHPNLDINLLEKLFRQSEFTVDGEDNIVQKYVSHDILFIFHHQVQSEPIIRRFLKALYEDKNRDHFIKDNTLLNENELFAAIKSKSYVLVTHRTLVKETYIPPI